MIKSMYIQYDHLKQPVKSNSKGRNVQNFS